MDGVKLKKDTYLSWFAKGIIDEIKFSEESGSKRAMQVLYHSF